MFMGWKNLKNHPDPYVRKRMKRECLLLKTSYAGAVWAMKRWYRHDALILNEVTDVLKGIYDEFGWKTRIVAAITGMYAYLSMIREDKRLACGWTYEPATRYEDNTAALALQLKKQQVSASSLVHEALQREKNFISPPLME
jgi:hypothetical protein